MTAEISAEMTRRWSSMDPTQRDLLLVLAAALAVRAVFCFAVYPSVADWFESRDGYDVIARNLADGRGYLIDGASAASERLPLYPLFLAASFFLFGDAAWPWQMLQCLFGAATCGLVLAIARRHAHRAGALAAALACALHPTLVLYTARPLTETLFIFLLLWWVYHLGDARLRPSRLGSLWGLALLTKATAAVHAVALVPLLRRQRLALLTRVLAVSAVMLLPWGIWNVATSGRPNLAAAPAGRTLYHGWYISRHVGWATPTGDLNRYAEFELWRDFARAGVPARATALERDAKAGELARAWIRRHPRKAARLWARNLLLTWYLGRSRASMLLYAVLHTLVLVAAVIGAARLWRRKSAARVAVATLVALILAYTGLHAAVQPAVRYILPAVPLALILAAAALGVESGRESYSSRGQRRAPPVRREAESRPIAPEMPGRSLLVR